MNIKLKSILMILISLAPFVGKAQITAQYLPPAAEIGALPGGTRYDAQTFTALESGVLSSIAVYAQSFGSPPTTISLNLLSTFAGAPTAGGLLASADFAGSALPVSGSTAYLAIDMAMFHIPLLAGQQYAIALSGSSTFAWLGTDGGYDGGSMFTSLDSGKSYTLFATGKGDRDLGFQALISSVPEVSASPLIIAAAFLVPLGSAVKRRLARRFPHHATRMPSDSPTI